jgi:hypothetical protein
MPLVLVQLRLQLQLQVFDVRFSRLYLCRLPVRRGGGQSAQAEEALGLIHLSHVQLL